MPRQARRALVGLFGVAAVAGAAVTGVAWAGADDSALAAPTFAGSAARSPVGSPSPSQSPPSPPAAGAASEPGVAGGSPSVAPPTLAGSRAVPDWGQVLARLDAVRGAAFGAADTTKLRAVYVRDSPALVRDRHTLLVLRGSDLRAVGVQLRASEVSVLERTSRQVRLSVSDSMPAYRLVDRSGQVQEQRPGRGLRSWTVVLRIRPGGRWGVYDVLRG